MCDQPTKTTMISNIVRSLCLAGAVLPLTLALSGAVNVGAKKATNLLEPSALEIIEKDLAKDCFRWMSAKSDSVVEKDAETNIDKYMGGTVEYETVCDWVLN